MYLQSAIISKVLAQKLSGSRDFLLWGTDFGGIDVGHSRKCFRYSKFGTAWMGKYFNLTHQTNSAHKYSCVPVVSKVDRAIDEGLGIGGVCRHRWRLKTFWANKQVFQV